MNPETLQNIAQSHGLHLDQVGALKTEIDRIASGEEESDNFVDNVEKALSVSTEKAIDIATDVNTEIFQPLRQKILREESEAPASSSEEMKREDILAEIENPTPAANPVSAISRVDTTQNKAANDFIAGKLSGTTVSTVQTAAATVSPAAAQPAAPTPKPKSYSVDPYREPVA